MAAHFVSNMTPTFGFVLELMLKFFFLLIFIFICKNNKSETWKTEKHVACPLPPSKTKIMLLIFSQIL